jgi:hypothetical protein
MACDNFSGRLPAAARPGTLQRSTTADPLFERPHLLIVGL